jgi:hypothetical protein
MIIGPVQIVPNTCASLHPASSGKEKKRKLDLVAARAGAIRMVLDWSLCICA